MKLCYVEKFENTDFQRDNIYLKLRPKSTYMWWMFLVPNSSSFFVYKTLYCDKLDGADFNYCKPKLQNMVKLTKL